MNCRFDLAVASESTEPDAEVFYIGFVDELLCLMGREKLEKGQEQL